MVTTSLDRDPTVLSVVAEPSIQQNPCCTILFAESLGADAKHGGTTEGCSAAVVGPGGFIAGAIGKHEGTIIKTAGNSVIAEFSEPFLAIQAAVEMQRQSETGQGGSSDSKQGLRIGIYSLEGQSSAIEMFGVMLSTASSITKQASSGQILISNTAYQEVSKIPF